MREPDDSEEPVSTTQVELSIPELSAQIVRFVMADPIDTIFKQDRAYRLDLCLTPRPHNARACFVDQWSPHRFEPLGDLFLVPPGHSLHVRGEGGRQLSVVCELQPDRIESWFDGQLEWSDRRLEASLDVTCPHIRSLMERLSTEMHRPGFAGPLLLECIAGQLAIELGRYGVAVEERPATGGLAAWRLRLIDDRLRDIQAPPTLAELAALCTLSIRQLTRGFRASRGCSIHDYVARARIEGAKRLLATDQSVKGIAFAMGFASPSSFAYAFRSATGSTPRQFRQRLLRRC